jgi:hypothetical protein
MSELFDCLSFVDVSESFYNADDSIAVLTIFSIFSTSTNQAEASAGFVLSDSPLPRNFEGNN